MIEQNMRLLMRHFWLLCIHCTGCRSRLDWSSCQHSCIWDDIMTVYCRPPVKLHMHAHAGVKWDLFRVISFSFCLKSMSQQFLLLLFWILFFLGVTQKKWNKKYYLNLKAFFCKDMYKPINIYRGAELFY